jgi:hypothetical protein
MIPVNAIQFNACSVILTMLDLLQLISQFQGVWLGCMHQPCPVLSGHFNMSMLSDGLS